MDDLKKMLEGLNKETGEEKKIQEENVAANKLQKLFKEYKAAGGECPDVESFLSDVIGFLEYKKLDGADIAKWDKEHGPEAN